MRRELWMKPEILSDSPRRSEYDTLDPRKDMKKGSIPRIVVAAFAIFSCAVMVMAQTPSRTGPAKNRDLGYDDTPVIPGQPYRVHDVVRPHPRVIEPAAKPGGAPSDAAILFDGTDLSKWTKGKSHLTGTTPFTGSDPAEWKVGDGYFEVAPGKGDIA